ncbi:helix-turn-helix transcriptional regulator (plasmid) [Macrococcoides canis]|uniref:helix-turn-helix transcriptional regulator n=1 Tax=Macrococcoides canis TaxID=1855823 RepID=UPI001F480DFD|nr:helix-turn-helix transcriptional regulator [Macrococcus canis]UJS29016.1 helix-turn-helix transcriptional regulator [Macrococcus canis]
MKNRIKEFRARDSLTQTDLANKVRVSRQTISLIERNKFVPSIVTAYKISKTFDETIENTFIMEDE